MQHPARRQVARAIGAPILWLLLIVGLAVTALELDEPYYFLNDDNRNYALPLYVENSRALAAGTLSQVNFWQALGMPQLAAGQPATLSPFPYLSIGVSTLCVGHPLAAIEMLVGLYLLLGGLGMLYCARQLRLPPTPALFAAVTWCLNPFFLNNLRSWIVFAPIVGLFPWMIGLLLALLHRPRPSVAVGLGFAHALLFVTGYPELFLYAVLIEAALAALLFLATRPRIPHRLTWLAVAGAVTIALCLPLLLPMAHQVTESAIRSGPLSRSWQESGVLPPWTWANGLLWPFARLFPPTSYYGDDGAPPWAAHQGWLALGLAAYATVRRSHRQPRTIRVLILRAMPLLVLLLLTLAAGLWAPALAQIPLLNRFRWPFKWMGFLAFPIALLAAAGLTRLRASCWRRLRPACGFTAVALQAINLVAFPVLAADLPYSRIRQAAPHAAPDVVALRDGRLFSIGNVPWNGSSLVLFNTASYWQLIQLTGYDPLLSRQLTAATLGLNHAYVPSAGAWPWPAEDLPIGYLREWGVRWYLIDPALAGRYQPWLEAAGMRLHSRNERRVIVEDPATRPLVAWGDGAVAPTPSPAWALEPNRITISTARATAGSLLVAWAYSDAYGLTVDDQPARLHAGPVGQLRIDLPPGRHRIQLVYNDPWLRLGLASGSLLAALLVLTGLLVRDRRRASRRRGA